MEYIAKNIAQTEKYAENIAKNLQKSNILLIKGGLGAGKSVFCRKIIRVLSNNNDLEVPSPTFTLVQTYDTPLCPVWHFDLYRLKDPEEIYELGWDDALSGGIMLVEWPERLGHLAPQKRHFCIDIDIINGEQGARKITMTEAGKE